LSTTSKKADEIKTKEVKKMKTEQTIQIEQLPIGDLRPDPANPRRISDQELETLTRSISEFGLFDPIIARREDKTVIGGHQRLLAARKLGYKTIPVVLADLTVEQAHLLNIALNKISGSFDQELLARLLKELQEVPNIDLSLSGFEDDELKKLLKSLDARERRDRIENFDLDAAIKDAQNAPIAKRGDIWLLGEHRVACGDSTDKKAVQGLMAGSKASMTFADPPYNVNYGESMKDKLRNNSNKIINDNLGDAFEPFLEKACKNILEFTDGAVYICMSSSELHTLQKAFIAAGGHWSTFIIWAKNTFTIGRSDYQRQYEPILYGWREGVTHYWCRDRDQGDVWQVDKPSSSPLHPTMKPLALIERAIQNSSQSGDKVLDTFLGSGSTLIACERTGRICYGMELEPLYVDIARMRWESFTGERAKRADEVK
jgi:DNA modification methylase